jgi:hypothetical protein
MRFSSPFTPLLRPFPPNTAASDAQQRNADQHHVSSTDADTPDDPWDPGVPVAQRRSHAPVVPAPQTAPADGRSRHKDRREEMYNVSRGKRSDAGRHVRTSDEDEDDAPLVPHHASSDPHATRVSHASGAHAASRDKRIAAHPVRPGPLFAALGHFLILQFSTHKKFPVSYCFSHGVMPRLTASTPTTTLAWASALPVLAHRWLVDVHDPNMTTKMTTTTTEWRSVRDIVRATAVSASSRTYR